MINDTTTSLLIKSKLTASATTRKTITLTHVNPEATDEELYELGAAVNNLTTTVDPIITKVTTKILLGGE